jgi:hypothetical protein
MRRIVFVTVLCCSALASGSARAIAPDVKDELDAGERALSNNDMGGASAAFAEGMRLAEQERDWDGMYYMSLGFLVVGSAGQALQAFRSAIDIAYEQAVGGGDCIGGYDGLRNGVGIYDQIADYITDPQVREALRQERDRADALAEEVFDTGCPGLAPPTPEQPGGVNPGPGGCGGGGPQ